MHGSPSQRSLHNAPIFRRLLKVAVNGAHQCDFSNFAGPNGPNCRLSTRSHDPYHTDGTIHSCWPTVATSCTPHIRSHCMRRVTPRFLAVRLSSCLRLQRLCMRRMHPMMPGLDNHLVGLHRELSCYHSRNCSWRALPIRGVCWPRAGVRRGGGALVLAVRPHACLNNLGCQQLVFVGLAVSAFGASAAAAGRRHPQC